MKKIIFAVITGMIAVVVVSPVCADEIDRQCITSGVLGHKTLNWSDETVWADIDGKTPLELCLSDYADYDVTFMSVKDSDRKEVICIPGKGDMIINMQWFLKHDGQIAFEFIDDEGQKVKVDLKPNRFGFSLDEYKYEIPKAKKYKRKK